MQSGAVLGYVEASETDAARFVKRAPEPPKGDVAEEVPGREEESAQSGADAKRKRLALQVDEAGLPPVAAGSHQSIKRAALPVPAGTKGAGYLSPRVRARMAELTLNAGRSRWHRRQRKRGPRHDQRSREFPRLN